MFGQPSGPQDRTQRTKLEIPMDMHSIVMGYRQRALCAPASTRSAVEKCAVLGVSRGVGGHERALRDYSFSVASQRFENPMRQS
jgi:hypothetical protein